MNTRAKYAVGGVVALCVALGLAQVTGLLDEILAQMAFRPLVIRGLGIEGDGSGGDPDQPTLRLQFIISLRSPEADRYVRMTSVVQLSSFEDRDELQKSSSKLRDTFIAKVVDCSSTELGGREGMARVKKMLQESVKKTRPDIDVGAVYFSEYIIH
jgi:hypothetical protein